MYAALRSYHLGCTVAAARLGFGGVGAARAPARGAERRSAFGADGYFLDHVAFTCSSGAFDALVARLHDHRIATKAQTVVRPDGEQRQVFFLDEDAYCWEYCECPRAPLAASASP